MSKFFRTRRIKNCNFDEKTATHLGIIVNVMPSPMGVCASIPAPALYVDCEAALRWFHETTGKQIFEDPLGLVRILEVSNDRDEHTHVFQFFDAEHHLSVALHSCRCDLGDQRDPDCSCPCSCPCIMCQLNGATKRGKPEEDLLNVRIHASHINSFNWNVSGSRYITHRILSLCYCEVPKKQAVEMAYFCMCSCYLCVNSIKPAKQELPLVLVEAAVDGVDLSK